MRLAHYVPGALVATLLVSFTPMVAGEMHLAWDSAAGATGYRVYYGTSSGNYTQSADVSGQTTTVLTNLQDCTEYYVAVRSLDSGGESSDISNEISGWARPAVTSNGQVQVMQGDQVWVTLAGANFESGADVELLTNGIPADENGQPLLRLENVTVQSCNEIDVLLTVESSARGQRSMEIGQRTLNFEIVNPDNVFAPHGRSFQIDFDPERCDVNRSDSDTEDRVDGQDLTWMAYSHGFDQGDARYNPDADLDGDGTVDGVDLAMLASDFGSCWNGSTWSVGACP
ncbi:MAG: fibronectin type III domain-containing protein [Acidobacteriota bacterium]|nr:fibronectin type III domain-containing protein [Acidobacteriota bacterium]MDH3786593.1 fibronectin type III domain-containing protein [Acidobacteriota bacterium]